MNIGLQGVGTMGLGFFWLDVFSFRSKFPDSSQIPGEVR